MALSIPCPVSRTVTVDEFQQYVEKQVDINDEDSIAASAPMLRALANDRNLIVRHVNRLVETSFRTGSLGSTQSINLVRAQNFIVRLNIWPSSADIAAGRVFQQDQFSYNVAHDHNFTFLTVNYDGPGYETDIYEYDYEKVEGEMGEPVELRFLERAKLSPGIVMLYRANKDVHIQHPPTDMTLTLNLVATPPGVGLRDQFAFDLERKVLLGYPPDHEGSRRVNLIEMVGYCGTPEAAPSLTKLAHSHPCKRTRLAALLALERLVPRHAEDSWARAVSDPAPLVSRTARKRLGHLSRL